MQKDWGIAQVVEHLPAKFAALSSIPSIEKSDKENN
jgi:hypothetical protein